MKLINIITLSLILTVFLACDKTELTATEKIDGHNFVENIEDISTDDNMEVIEDNMEDILNNENQEQSEQILKYLSECDFEKADQSDGYIDETERAIMKTCEENRLNNNKAVLIENLIGQWELIGSGSGRIPQKQPCAYLNIAKSSLTVGLKNDYVDTVATYNWKINERELLGELHFFLSTDQPMLSGLSALGGIISKDYMYSDATPVDGNMFLYQKVK